MWALVFLKASLVTFMWLRALPWNFATLDAAGCHLHGLIRIAEIYRIRSILLNPVCWIRICMLAKSPQWSVDTLKFEKHWPKPVIRNIPKLAGQLLNRMAAFNVSRGRGVGSSRGLCCQAVLGVYPGYPSYQLCDFGSVSLNFSLLICNDTNDSTHLHRVIVKMNRKYRLQSA